MFCCFTVSSIFLKLPAQSLILTPGVSGGAGGKQYLEVKEASSTWRCRRQDGYQEVQEANNGCLEVHKAGSGYLEVQEQGCLHRTVKKIYVMILSRPFLVPFLVPAFLLSQVPLGPAGLTRPFLALTRVSNPVNSFIYFFFFFTCNVI